MRLVHLIGVLGAVGLLAGCASNIKQMEEVQATGGTPFTQALTEEYRSFVAHEKDERDWSAADYFAIKGLAAAGGQVVLPEAVGDVGEHGPALTDARAKLMAALDGGARDSNPQVAARAQRAFDCWNHEAEEDNWYESITDDHVKPCRDEFAAAMAQLVPPPMTVNPNEYIVLFDFDKSKINNAGKAVIDQVLADAAKAGGVHISATGHADRAGSEDYNMALSLRRADSVREALIAGGVSADAITVAGRGESEPAVPTADGVKEQANRRVVIVLQ
ncbi:MAG TPA: OmpA family protein [Candidatus Angelobacter sp.]|nr:OmpA family protein [Candidatus Angelobacter sp.]